MLYIIFLIVFCILYLQYISSKENRVLYLQLIRKIDSINYTLQGIKYKPTGKIDIVLEMDKTLAELEKINLALDKSNHHLYNLHYYFGVVYRDKLLDFVERKKEYVEQQTALGGEADSSDI